MHIELVLGLICVYFLVLLLAIVRSRYLQTGQVMPGATEFFLAGRSLSTPVLVATFVGTLFSAFTVVGVPSAVYAKGVTEWWTLFGGGLVMVSGILLFGKVFRRYATELGAFSPVEVVSRTYKSKSLGVLMAIIILVFLTPYLSVQLVGMGKLLQSVSGGDIGYLNGVGFIMATILFYLMFGGMRAVAYTDFIQAILIFAGIIGTVTLFVIHFFGDLGTLFAQAAAVSPQHMAFEGTDNRYTWPLVVSAITFYGFLVISQPQTLTRFMMAKDPKQIYYIAALTLICLVIGYGGGTILGLGGVVIFPDLAEPNLLPGQILNSLMELHTTGLVVAGMLLLGVIAASMSTADSLLIAIGQLFTRDIARPYIELSHGVQVKIAKVIMVVVLGAAFGLGLKPPPVMLDLASYSFTGTMILVPVIVGMVWKRRSRTGAFLAVILGEGTFLTLLFMGIKPLGFHPSMAGLAISFCCVVIAGLLRKPCVSA